MGGSSNDSSSHVTSLDQESREVDAILRKYNIER